MQFLILALAAAASCASAQTPSSTPSASASPFGAVIPIGENCDPDGVPCALGANCYATNSMLQTVCGNFQSACTIDEQCAFNTCNKAQGLCNGFIPSSSAASPTITSTTPPAGGFTPAPPSTVTAPAGSLPLGAECNALAASSQCSGDVECWASNAGLIARCGNFNAGCKKDADCAFNSCNNGLCNGFLPSSSLSSLSSSAGNATSTVQATGTLRPTGSAVATTSLAEYTGAASVANVAGEMMAVVIGAVAWAL